MFMEKKENLKSQVIIDVNKHNIRRERNWRRCLIDYYI